MTRRQKRKIVIIAILLILLTLVGAYFAYFSSTKRLDVDIQLNADEVFPMPVFLYSFSGPDGDLLQRPVGVDVIDDEVWVSDARRQKVYVFTLEGEFKRKVGGDEMVVPLYIADNPKDGNVYITDRRSRSVHIYTKAGKYLRDFDPKLPEDQLPAFETKGVQWAPVALAFDGDGRMYFTEILNGHRLLVFSPEGEFQKSSGTVGIVTKADAAPEVFQFPNSVKVHGDEVWVADSNNRRVQVFDKDGNYVRLVVTEGLPRGLDFLAKRSAESSATDKFVTIDTLAQDGTIWDVKGEKILTFGTRGVLEGQFSYPNDVSVGPKNLIFITDSSNARVQVWGWPEEVSPVPLPEVAQYWRWCFAPLLLLPLLLFLRKKKFFATEDFVRTMYEYEELELMPERRRKWLVIEAAYKALSGLSQGGVDLADLLNVAEYSESDTRAIMDKFELDHETAVILAIAQRAHVFCTEDMELRRLARTLEIDVVNREEYLDRFTKQASDAGPKDEM